MVENIEKGPNFVEPPKKAEAMAYAEKEQRDRDDRRERAGLSVDLEKREEAANREGESWENVQSVANEYIEKNINLMDDILEERRKSCILTDFERSNSYAGRQKEKIIDATAEKIKAYLGEDSSQISVTFDENYRGRPHFILERKESQEE